MCLGVSGIPAPRQRPDLLLHQRRCPEAAFNCRTRECGAWVSSELIGPDGAGEAEDGGFYCTSCRFRDEEADEGLGDSDLAADERIINRSRGDRSG